MSDLASDSADPVTQPDAYIASLLQALGSTDPMEVLAETPRTLRAAVADLTRQQDAIPERPGKWSVRQVVQHLADSDLVGAFRFRMVLAHDAPELPGYDRTSGRSAWHIRKQTSRARCTNSRSFALRPFGFSGAPRPKTCGG